MPPEKSSDYLSLSTCLKDPFDQFNLWSEEEKTIPGSQPEAAHLATVSKEGKPSGRMVLIKFIHDRSFVFFTNLKSRKAEEITHTPFVALTFYWASPERQVRIEGAVTPAPKELSDTYFSQRPEGSRISAWISPQSKTIPSREVLEKAHAELSRHQQKDLLTRPPHWGGYAVNPFRFEFWQGRPDRLHDRIQYVKTGLDLWEKKRLAP